MSRDEDQQNEMEVMEAIYGADYSVISAEPPRKYQLTLTPNQDGSANHVSCRLTVQYPATYPDVRPVLTLQSISGLSKQHLTDVTALANTEADNGVGSESMLQISQVIRDWLVDHNQPTLSMHEQMEAAKGGDSGGAAGGDEDGESEEDEDEPQEKKDARREKRELERRANRGPSPLNITPGTLVTTQSFMEWKARFDDEQRRKREEEEKARAARDMKMTGKQLFLANLAKELQDDEADGMEEETVEGGVAGAAGQGGKDKTFWFNAAVYADDDAELPEEEEREEHSDDDEDEDDEDEEGDEKKENQAKQAADEQRRKEEQRQAEEAKEQEKKRQQKAEADRQQAQQKQKPAPQPSKQADAAKGGKAQQQQAGGGKKEVKGKSKK